MKTFLNNALLDFFLDPKNETEESVAEYLYEEGYNIDELNRRFEKLLKKSRATLLLEKGKKFKNYFISFQEKVKTGEINLSKEEPALAGAFRKLEDSAGEDSDKLLDHIEKMKILKLMESRD